MINFIVLDRHIEIQADSMPTGFEPVALINLPYCLSGKPFEAAVMLDIAMTIVEQNCLSGNLPVDWCSDELPMDRYAVVEISNNTADSYSPYIPTIRQTGASYQIWLGDEPVAYSDGINSTAEIAISTAKNLGWLDNASDYTAVETELTELMFGKSPLIKIY